MFKRSQSAALNLYNLTAGSTAVIVGIVLCKNVQIYDKATVSGGVKQKALSLESNVIKVRKIPGFNGVLFLSGHRKKPPVISVTKDVCAATVAVGKEEQ